MEPCSLNTHNPNTQEVLWTKGRLKQNVILHINEYIVEELTDIYKNICDQAKDHLNDNERILTLGYSCVVEAFLKHGLKKRTFEVIVAEHSPECDGFKMAKALAEAGIQVTLIPDASIFAMMSRVNKILVGAHAVLANGGVMGRSGTHMMAVAAKAHRLPLVVLAGHYKLSPIFPVNPLQFSDMVSPSSLIPYEMVQKINPQKHLGPDAAQFHVINPHCDYVPPSAIHTYITNNGVHSPSYIYRLMAELYNPEDYEL
jgi:translation initiation factor eIF-2B subunit beta